EVVALAPRLGRTASQAVGYRQLLDVVGGRSTVDEGFAAAERATMALLKRQRTFFRRDPRLQWLDADEADLASVVIDEAGL
ncbi:MAG TPA: tRNA (adenosine(37)-N6)-dimethylallyltransferase MiaA, partial [Acidimicrobiia bacterium]|nr:tRNA (adenosine(37)-N6)-dimethylallyltransferase MiaA [Acidimicrobiia bacterium]